MSHIFDCALVVLCFPWSGSCGPRFVFPLDKSAFFLTGTFSSDFKCCEHIERHDLLWDVQYHLLYGAIIRQTLRVLLQNIPCFCLCREMFSMKLSNCKERKAATSQHDVI